MCAAILTKYYSSERESTVALLHCDGLCEISRLVDVVPAQDGEVVTQQLQRDDVDQRLQAIAHLGNLDEHLIARRVFIETVVVLADDEDAPGVSGAKLLDDGFLLGERRVARGDDD